MEYTFEWDLQKAKNNYIKHKVNFTEAASVLKDSRAISIFDEEHSEDEDRWITLGISTNGRLIVVCHPFVRVDNKNVSIRIISARKTVKKEQKQYLEG